MPYVSGCGPDSEPGRGGIAAPTHVLDDSLGSQRRVQLVGVCAWHCFEHCICPSGQLDAHGTHMEAAGKPTEKSDLCPDYAGHVVQDLGRQLFGIGALVHRFEGPITARMAGPAGQCGARPNLVTFRAVAVDGCSALRNLSMVATADIPSSKTPGASSLRERRGSIRDRVDA